MANRNEIQSDLDAIRKKSPGELREAAMDDPDSGPLTREMMARAVPWGELKRTLVRKKDIHIFLDEDIIDFFKKETGGKRGYQTLINGVLRQYMEHSRRA